MMGFVNILYIQKYHLYWSFCLLDDLLSLWPWRSMVKDSLMLSILAPYISCVCFWWVPDFVLEPIYHQVLCLYRIHPKKYVHGSHFVVFCWGQILADFIHILQDYFIDTGTHICNHCFPSTKEATFTNICRYLWYVMEILNNVWYICICNWQCGQYCACWWLSTV